jgi:hypothetical protein
MIKELYHIPADPGITIKRTARGKKAVAGIIERWDLLSKQGLTEEYTRFDNPYLDKPIVIPLPEGEGVRILKGAIGVRNELYPFIKNYFERPDYGRFEQLNFATKSLKLGFSFFHHVSLGMQELAHGRIPFKNIPFGQRLMKEGGAEMRLLHKEGLEIKGYEDINYNRLFTVPEKTAFGRNMNRALRVLQYPITQGARFLFQYIQPGMKSAFAYNEYVKGLPKALEEGLTKEQWARKTVKAADGFFSGEDAVRGSLESWRITAKLYFNPAGRRIFQAGFLSPTWQREHLLVAGRVAQSALPKALREKLGIDMSTPEAHIYRRYFAGALTLYAAANMYNYYMTKKLDGEGKFMFQNEGGKFFQVRAPFNYPKDKNGVEAKAWIRPLKSIFEVPEFLHGVFAKEDPLTKVSYKLSPWIKATAEQIWNFDYYGKKYKEGEGGIGRRALDWTIDVTEPFSGEQLEQIVEGKLPKESLPFTTFGMPISKSKPVTDPALEEALKGQKEETSLSETQATEIYDSIKDLPRDSQNQRVRELFQSDRQIAMKVRGLIEEERLGLTPDEKKIKSLHIENEARAKFIADKARPMTITERREYFIDLRRKKILTERVYQQVQKQLRQR